MESIFGEAIKAAARPWKCEKRFPIFFLLLYLSGSQPIFKWLYTKHKKNWQNIYKKVLD